MDPNAYWSQRPVPPTAANYPNAQGVPRNRVQLATPDGQVVEPEPSTYQDPAPQYAPTPAPAPQQGYNPYDQLNAYNQQSQAEMARLAAERDALARRAAEAEDLARSLYQQNSEARRTASVDEIVESLGELDTLGTDDAKRLLEPVLKTQQEREAALAAELARQRQELAQTQQRMHSELLNAEIRKYHPDFLRYDSDPAFQAFMRQRDGLSSETRDQRAAREYAAGNAQYVIGVLNEFKRTRPDANQLTSVNPAMGGSVPGGQRPNPGAGGQLDTRELIWQVQNGTLTPDQYRKIVQDWRAQQQKAS